MLAQAAALGALAQVFLAQEQHWVDKQVAAAGVTIKVAPALSSSLIHQRSTLPPCS